MPKSSYHNPYIRLLLIGFLSLGLFIEYADASWQDRFNLTERTQTTNETDANHYDLPIVATPNPNTFPLLLALHRYPDLPVRLLPVAGSKGIDESFANQEAEALLSMTYTAAKKIATGAIPDLQIAQVNLWRGFFAVTNEPSIQSFQDLSGKGFIISGPVGGAKNGGPDAIFQAALSRAGLSLDDVNLCYLPVMEAVALLTNDTPMNSNEACDARFDFPASGISLVEPAASSLVMMSQMASMAGTQAMSKSIDYQTLFTDYTQWANDYLPHGGVSILAETLNDPNKQDSVQRFLQAYNEAVEDLEQPRSLRHLWRMSQIISQGISEHYGQYGLQVPAPAIMKALKEQALVFSNELSTVAIADELSHFLSEVTQETITPAMFWQP
ncbi:MAG: hypothetical protein ACWA5U_11260 [bacterium]